MTRKFAFLLFCFISFTSIYSSNVDSLKTVLKALGSDTNRVNTLNLLGKVLEYSDAETSLIYINEALALAEKISFKKGAAKANINKGNYYFHKSNYPEALKRYQASLKISESLNNKNGIASAYIGIGLVYTYKGDYPKAIENNLKGLKVKEELGDKVGQAVVLSNIGELYMYQSRYDESLLYHKKSLALEESIDNKQGMADSYSNIAGIFFYQKKLNDALEYYNLSMKMSEALGDKPGKARVLSNIGILHQQMGNYNEAYNSFQLSLNIKEELGDKNGIANTYLALGQTLVLDKRNEDALKALEKAEIIATSIGRKSLVAEIYSVKSKAFGNLKDFEKGLKYHNLYSSLKDSILNEENSKQMNELSAKYDTEKKEKEIEILTKENKIQNLEINNKMLIIYSAIGILLLLLFLTFSIYKRYQLKQKANTVLSSINTNIEKQKQEIELKNNQLGIKNKEITDSIKYAQNIQVAILPPDSQVKKLLPDSFVLYKPKDIVSGDFYWMEEWGNNILVAAVDCTGHGVPGAFMSIVGSNLLQQAVFNFGLSKPFLILNNLNKNISRMLHQSKETSSVKDGMDIALISIDKTKRTIEYSGAYNPMWVLRDGNVLVFKADKHPIGAFVDEELKQFTNQQFESQPGDIIYIFTDGYSDQFGGPKGKKFKHKQLKDLILTMQGLSMDKQKDMLDKTLREWKGKLEQVDDILIIGIRL